MLVGGSKLFPRKLELRTRSVRDFVLVPQGVKFPLESPNFVSISFLRTPLAVPLLWLRGSEGPHSPCALATPPTFPGPATPSASSRPGELRQGRSPKERWRSGGPGTVRGPGDGVRGSESDHARDQQES